MNEGKKVGKDKSQKMCPLKNVPCNYILKISLEALEQKNKDRRLHQAMGKESPKI